MELKQNHTDFQKEISDRGIQHLIHFTPTINLLSIFEQGKLLSRALLEKFDIDQTDIFDYIELFYNSKRRHNANNLLSPIDYENQFKKTAEECL